MFESLGYGAAFMFGLLGSSHCLGMCGGIMGALGMFSSSSVRPIERMLLILGYNLGRIFSYAVAGLLVGLLSSWLQARFFLFATLVQVMAALLLIAMGGYLAGFQRLLLPIERIGQQLWRRVAPVANQMLPVRRFRTALLAGLIWGWLPCGLVYATLGWAATAESAWQSALTMLAFGLGTLPLMFVSGLAFSRFRLLLAHPYLRSLNGLLVALFGLWNLSRLLAG
jgi:hypothetical protein